MAWCDVHWWSDVLKKQVGSYILLPETGTPPFPVFYLLHGLSDDYTIWMRRTRIETYHTQPMIIVMPDGFRGAYTRNEQGPDYDKYLVHELPAFVERHFAARTDRAGRCIGGLSMGGYGAARAALAHPDRYVSANSHSGAVLWGSRPVQEDRGSDFARDLLRIFGPDPTGSHHDTVALAKKIPPRQRPALRLDCGTEDFLLEDNRKFHAQLTEMGYDHEYAEYPGGHEWSYWDLHVREALAFHARHLGIEPPAAG